MRAVRIKSKQNVDSVLRAAIVHSGKRPLKPLVVAISMLISGYVVAADESSAVPPVVNTAAALANDKSQDVAVDEIVVTAQHKKENLQKAPISATVLGKRQLEEQNISSVRDLAGEVPNLTQPRSSISYSTATYFIRGIGEADPIQQSGVAVYADDLYIPRSISSMLDFNDVKQVEVLRGPQGTLYGRNSSAGVVRVITDDPNNTTKASVEVGAGNYGAVETHALISGPIIQDELYGSLSLIHLTRDGTSKDPTRNIDVNNIDLNSLRAKLRATPTPDWDIQLTLSGLLDRSQTTSYTPYVQPNGAHQPWVSYSSLDPTNHLDQGSAILRAIYTIDPHLQFKSVTTDSEFTQPVNYDNSGSAAQLQQNLIVYKQKYFTQDFQLNGHYDRFDFTTGLFFFHENFEADRNNNTFSAAKNITTRYGEYSTTTTDNAAIYGQGTYKLTDLLHATAGVRYDYEKQDFDYNHYFLNQAQQIIGLDFHANPSKSWNSFTPKIGLDYQWTPSINEYFTIARGFKAGGFDNRSPTLAAANLGFQPETVTTYETGIKSELFDRRLRINADIFYNDYKDLQATAIDPATGVSQRFNAASAKTYGAEIETTEAITHNLNLRLNVAYLDATYGNFVNAEGLGTNAQDKSIVNSPKWNASAGVSYIVPVNLPGILKTNADYLFQTKSFTDPLNTDPFLVPTQKFVNANISYVTPDQHWTTTLAVKNLLNGAYAQSAAYSPGTTAHYENYNAPRTWVLSLKYDF